MKQLKVAYLSVFYPFRGGIAQFNNELLLALKKHCEVKAFNFSRQYPQLLFPGKTQLVTASDPDPKIDAEAVLDSMNPISYLSAANKINAYQPDVVITAYWMPFFAPSLGTVLKRIKAKKIGLLHNVIPHEKGRLDDLLNQYYLKQNSDFVVLSDTVEKQLKQYVATPSLLKISHPLYRHFGKKMDQSTARKQLGIGTNKQVVLFFGFIRKYKGLDLLIEAMNLMDENVVLLIAGESYEGAQVVEDYIQQSGVAPSRIFAHVKYISDEEVKLYFSASDVCALPYRTATQSGIASIAKHFEIPMVLTPVGELPNEVQHGKNGFVCSEVHPTSIQEGLKVAIQQKELYALNQQKENEENTFDHFAEKLFQYLNGGRKEE